MATSTTFKGEPLIGHSNYIEWLNQASLFLEINSFMPYIDNSEQPPNKSLYMNSNREAISSELALKYNEKLSEYQRNNRKALGAIKSLLSLEIIKRFKDKDSPNTL
jgi:hypothetical protein